MGMPFIIGASQQKKKRILGFEPYVAPDDFDRKAQPVDIYDVFERYYRNHRDAKYIYSVTDTFATNIELSAGEMPLNHGHSNAPSGIIHIYSYVLDGVRYSHEIPTPKTTEIIPQVTSVITVDSTAGWPSSGKILVQGGIYIGIRSNYYFTYTSKDDTHFYGASQTIMAQLGKGHPLQFVVPWVGTKRYVIVKHPTTSPMPCYIGGAVKGPEWLYCGDKINNINTSYGDGQCVSLKYVHIHKLDNITSIRLWENVGTPFTGTLHLPNYASWDEWGSQYNGCKLITKIDFRQATFIRNNSFRGCTGLTELTIPDVFTSIPDGAFYGCTGLPTVNLGSGITSIGLLAFYNCTGLDGTLTIPNSCLSIGNQAFQNCNKLDSINFGTGIQTIGNSAFQSCTSFTALSLSSSITTIGALAFYGCTGMTGTLTIASGITSIGQGAFGDDNFTDIDVTANAGYEDVDNVLYEISTRTALHSVKSDTGTITFQSNTIIIGDYCCLRNQRTGTLTVPDSVTRVGIYAFYDCNGFTAISLEASSSSLATIDDYAFSHCSNLAGTLTLPNSVTLVDAQAFQDDVLITGIVFSSALVTIGANAFRQMTAISENLVIPNSVETIGATAFYNNTARTGTLTLGTGLKTIGRLAFENVPFTGTLAIPSLVTAIGERAFSNNNFSAISSAASGFTVFDYVLYDEFTSGQIKAHTSARGYAGTLTLKTGTTSILVYCFYNNTNRSGTLTLLSTITNINASGFEGCTAFNRVDSYPATAPTVASAGLTLWGTARPLHIPTGGGTGYGVAPWTTATIFTQPPVADL